MMVFQLVTYLSNSIDQYVVLGYLGVRSLGVYTVVLTASSAVILVLMAPLISTLVPGMSERYGGMGVRVCRGSLRLQAAMWL